MIKLDDIIEKKWFRPVFYVCIIIIDMLLIWGTITGVVNLVRFIYE